MNINDLKEVRFDLYCSKCKYENKEMHEDPCDECLNEPANTNSVKPVRYEEKNT